MAHAVSTVRIFLVDDHDLVRNAVRMVLAGEEDFEVIGEARSFADALASSSLASADVAILDVRLADGDGATLCGLLKAAHPSLTCLMLTSVDDAAARSAALAAGATAFILKTIHGTQLTEQIRSALIGVPRTPRPPSSQSSL